MAAPVRPWLDRVRVVAIGWSDVVRSVLAFVLKIPLLSAGLAGCKVAVRWLSLHTGVPALLVAAVLIAVGYRLLKRTARFAVEVAAVTLALALASELGWLRW